MNLTSMEYFVALARERSFTKAAQQLHITQQSLSAHIAALEQELGCQLLVRRVPLELTYAGTVFLRYAANFQRELGDLHREFSDITNNQRGILRIGIAFTRGRTIMPDLITAFQRQYPNITIELSEAPNRMLHQNLLNREIDLAIANFPDTLQGAQLQDFYREEIVLLLSDQLLERFPFDGDLTALKDCPFVLGNSNDIAGRMGRKVIAEAGFQPIIKAKSDNMETLLALCVRGVGACFCPEILARAVLSPAELSGLRMFRLGEQAKYPIRFGYLKSTYQWNMIDEFMRLARQTL